MFGCVYPCAVRVSAAVSSFHMFGTVISLVALGLSVFVLVDSRRLDRRDLLLKLHEQLNTKDRSIGRRLVYQLASQPVESWAADQFDQVNDALAYYDVIGMYVELGYVRKDDVLRLWAEPAYRAWRAVRRTVPRLPGSTGRFPAMAVLRAARPGRGGGTAPTWVRPCGHAAVTFGRTKPSTYPPPASGVTAQTPPEPPRVPGVSVVASEGRSAVAVDHA